MTDWAKNGACRDKPHDWWFPSHSHSPTRAIEICNTCPVKAECLEFALRTDQRFGIWGGLNVEERQKQRQYRVIHCNRCGVKFVWLPVGGHVPKFCSGVCRRRSANESQYEADLRRSVSQP